MKVLNFILFISIIFSNSRLYPTEGKLSPSEVEKIVEVLSEFDHSSDIRGDEENGIRKDIEKWILKQNYNDDIKFALRQEARTYQRSLTINVKNKKEMQKLGDEIMKSGRCLAKYFSIEESVKQSNLLKKYTVNTKERFESYMKFNRALNGFALSYNGKEPCEK